MRVEHRYWSGFNPGYDRYSVAFLTCDVLTCDVAGVAVTYVREYVE